MSNTETIQNPISRILKDKYLILFLSIFYLVGAVGMSLEEYKEQFIALSAFHLSLNLAVLLLSKKSHTSKFYLLALAVLILGMVVETIGTKTALLFGSYTYGNTLGLKIFGVPLIIGVNWLVLVIGCSSWVKNLKTSIWVKTLLAAALMTALDFLIEPIAVEFNYWTWTEGEIPLFNYLCWFALSLPMHFAMLKWDLLENSKVPKAIVVMMFLFFIYLNLI